MVHADAEDAETRSGHPGPGASGPYIAWVNHGCYEGWAPYSYDTLEAALRHQSYGVEPPVITKLVQFKVVETE